MLTFLKKIFQKEDKESEKETLKIENIESWLDKKIKEFNESLDSNLQGYIGKLDNEISDTKKNLDVLGNAKLHNPNITVREKQFMEGNREAYLKRVDLFLKGLSLEKKDFKALKEVCSSFDKELEGFGKSTFKAYQVLQHFFAHESRNIAINIKNLERIFKELKGFLDRNDIAYVEKMKKESVYLKDNMNRKDELKSLLDKEAHIVKELEDKRMKAEKEIKELHGSQRYKEFKGLADKQEGVNGLINDHKSMLLQSFSILEHSLKKYVRMILEEEDVLKDYIENPVSSLLEDKELKILKILKGLEKNIIEDKIELKDKKRDRTLDEIRKLNKEFFEDFIDKYTALDDGLLKLKKEIEENKIRDKEEELKNKSEEINKKIEKIRDNIDNLKKEFNDIHIQKLKENLEKEIKENLKVDVVISFS